MAVGEVCYLIGVILVEKKVFLMIRGEGRFGLIQNWDLRKHAQWSLDPGEYDDE